MLPATEPPERGTLLRTKFPVESWRMGNAPLQSPGNDSEAAPSEAEYGFFSDIVPPDCEFTEEDDGLGSAESRPTLTPVSRNL